jgi:homeobox protein cut-like
LLLLQVAESKQQLEAAQAQLADLAAKTSDQEQLIHQLEEDLRAAAGSAAVAAAVAGIAGMPNAAASGRDATGSGTGEGLVSDQGGSEGSMVRVLAGQRDRLRTRVQELEQQLATTAAQLQEAQGLLEAAKADNIALVERLRYVGGYRQQTASRVLAEANGGGVAGGEGGDVESGRSAEVVGRYTRMYEEGINPFKEFQVSSYCRGVLVGGFPLYLITFHDMP